MTGMNLRRVVRRCKRFGYRVVLRLSFRADVPRGTVFDEERWRWVEMDQRGILVRLWVSLGPAPNLEQELTPFGSHDL